MAAVWNAETINGVRTSQARATSDTRSVVNAAMSTDHSVVFRNPYVGMEVCASAVLAPVAQWSPAQVSEPHQPGFRPLRSGGLRPMKAGTAS